MTKEFSILIDDKPLTNIEYQYSDTQKKYLLKSIKTEKDKPYLKYDTRNVDRIRNDISINFPERKVEIIEYRKLLVNRILNIIYKTQEDIYSKTERVLYSKEAIEDIILTYKDEVRKLKESQKDIPTFTGKSKKMIIDGIAHTYVYADDSLNNRISLMMQQISILESHLRLLSFALSKVSLDPYYQLIEEIYFKGTNYDDITEKYNWKRSTITKHKKDLVSKISAIIFAEEYYLS